jgi:hypothetical protein
MEGAEDVFLTPVVRSFGVSNVIPGIGWDDAFIERVMMFRPHCISALLRLW